VPLLTQLLNAKKIEDKVEEPEQADEPEEKTKKRGKRKCDNCGKSGHTTRTCPNWNRSAQRQDEVGEEEAADLDLSDEADGPTASDKIRELLKAGKDDGTISIETGQTVRVIKFIRDQMRARGEI
jgi:hypothetical protein